MADEKQSQATGANAAGKGNKKVPSIEVMAAPEKGFYRAGRHWPHEKTIVPLEELGKDKKAQDAAVDAIMAEPKLIATLVQA